MKYLLIFFYFSQACPGGDPRAAAPPYFYMRSFDTYEEARKAEVEFDSSGEGQGAVVYGYPQFGNPYEKIKFEVIK